MTAKEYLSQAFYLDRSIKSLENQLESIKAHEVFTTAHYSERVSSSPAVVSAIEEAAVRIAELEERIGTEISKLVSLKKEITNAIRSIGNTEYEIVLEMRYLSFMKWEEICKNLGYSRRYVFSIHGRALEMIKFL